MRNRVLTARKRQDARGRLNRDLERDEVDTLDWHADAAGLLDVAMRSVELTARGWERVRRVAVTIADLAETDVIRREHVAEALALRGRA